MNRNQNQWCFSWFSHRPYAASVERAALVKANQWSKQAEIKIVLLNGDSGVQQRVKDAVRGWVRPGMADLEFVFLNDPAEALGRISF
jgi:hypothetical protein